MTSPEPGGASVGLGPIPQDFAHVPLAYLLQLIRERQVEAELVRDPTIGTPSIVVYHATAITRIRVRPVEGDSSDRIPLFGVLTVETDFPRRPTPSSSADLSRINVAPALGAAILDEQWQATRVVSRYTLFTSNVDVWPFYGPLIVATATMAARISELAFDDFANGEGPEAIATGDPGELGPSPWSAEDIGAAVEWLRSKGFRADGVATKLIANVPFVRPNDRNPPKPIKPCPLYVHANALHPYLGMGLMVRLELPVQLASAREGELLAWTLNDFDTRLIDGPPLAGAWYYRPDTNVVEHMSFVPRSLALPGSCLTLVTWMAWRACYAAEWCRDDDSDLRVPVLQSL